MFSLFIWTYLCWRKLSCRLKYLPQTSHENVTSGLLWVRSCIMRLYGFVKRRWQYLQMNSHFGRILRRKSDRQSSLSIRITANIMANLFGYFLLSSSRSSRYFLSFFRISLHQANTHHSRALSNDKYSATATLYGLSKTLAHAKHTTIPHSLFMVVSVGLEMTRASLVYVREAANEHNKPENKREHKYIITWC